MKTLRLGFLASHNGSNMQAIILACKNKKLNAIPCVVISNNGDSGALEKAKNDNIPGFHLSSYTHPDPSALDIEMLNILNNYKIDYLILAGYMKKLGDKVLNYYENKILNIHPALLPKYGGKGMYGANVHKAVLDAGEKETGVTIHLVTSEYDTGKILGQKKVQVLKDDTVETLSQRVLETEHKFYVEIIDKISKNEIII